MKKINLLPALACVIAMLFSAPLSAQEANSQKLEKLDEPTPPTITIREPSTKGAKITEERDGGEVKKVKVKSGGSTYYLKPKGVKASPPSDAHMTETSVPQWVVKEFDSGQKTDNAEKSDGPPVTQ